MAIDDGTMVGTVAGQYRQNRPSMGNAWIGVELPQLGAGASTLSMHWRIWMRTGSHIFAFHRSIGETEDPFGTDVIANVGERYDRRAPPTVVFNAFVRHRSVPEGDLLGRLPRLGLSLSQPAARRLLLDRRPSGTPPRGGVNLPRVKPGSAIRWALRLGG